MKEVRVEFGIEYQKIPQGWCLPPKYKFKADANVGIVGTYGISSNTNVYKSINVMVPDWAEESQKWRPGHLARVGYESNCGTDHLCFVVCKKPVEMVCDYFGEADQMQMIEQAIAGGLLFWYPTKTGEMESMEVFVAE